VAVNRFALEEMDRFLAHHRSPQRGVRDERDAVKLVGAV
jgi:hypothetical protein